MYTMIFKKLSDSEATIYLNWFKKSIILLVSLFLFLVAWSDFPNPLWIALALAVISLAAGIYRESWFFVLPDDTKSSLKLTSYIGIWPAIKKRQHTISNVTAIRVFTPKTHLQAHLSTQAQSWGYYRLARKFEKSISKIELHTHTEGTFLLYTDNTKNLQTLIGLADEIATFLQVPREIHEGYRP